MLALCELWESFHERRKPPPTRDSLQVREVCVCVCVCITRKSQVRVVEVYFRWFSIVRLKRGNTSAESHSTKTDVKDGKDVDSR